MMRKVKCSEVEIEWKKERKKKWTFTSVTYTARRRNNLNKWNERQREYQVQTHAIEVHLISSSDFFFSFFILYVVRRRCDCFVAENYFFYTRWSSSFDLPVVATWSSHHSRCAHNDGCLEKWIITVLDGWWRRKLLLLFWRSFCLRMVARRRQDRVHATNVIVT